MGLAPYGEPRYAKLIKEKLITIAADGSFQLDMSYFDYATGLTMTNKKIRFLCLVDLLVSQKLKLLSVRWI